MMVPTTKTLPDASVATPVKAEAPPPPTTEFAHCAVPVELYLTSSPLELVEAPLVETDPPKVYEPVPTMEPAA